MMQDDLTPESDDQDVTPSLSDETKSENPLDEVQAAVVSLRKQLAQVIVGQDEVIDQLLLSILSSGHCLLVGVPGLAKTLLVSAISKTIDLDFSRIQFTIDLLPSDILGSEILDQKTNEFKVI